MDALDRFKRRTAPLVKFSQKLETREPLELVFLARELIQATLPHSNPNSNDPFVRRNGRFAVVVQTGYDHTGTAIGLPYGSIPRLLLAYITTEAVRTRERKIDLGDTLTEFCRHLGLNPSNGEQLHRLRNQMRRLFSASITFHEVAQRDNWTIERRVNLPIVSREELWFFHDKKGRDQHSLFGGSFLELNEDFFQAVVRHPVPLDLSVLKLFRNSPLMLDVVSWAAYRCTTARGRSHISWSQLEQQFGCDYTSVKDFRKRFRHALTRVRMAVPHLNIAVVPGGVVVGSGRGLVEPVSISR